jgi:WD40 repeat protein
LWDTTTGERRAELAAQPYAFIRNGSALLTLLNGSITVCDARNGQPLREFVGARYSYLAVSRDGRRLAALRPPDPVVELFDIEREERTAVLDCGGELLSLPSFAPDGRGFRITDDGEGPVLATLSGTTRRWRLNGWDRELIAHLSFSPDSAHLAARGVSTVRVWRLTDSKGVSHLEGRGNGIHWCDFLPDGRLLTFSRRDNAVKLWPAELFRPGGGAS